MENATRATSEGSSSSATSNYSVYVYSGEWKESCEYRLPCGWCKKLEKQCDASKKELDIIPWPYSFYDSGNEPHGILLRVKRTK